MVSISSNGIAIGVAFFLFRSSTAIFGEFMPLYMKQLGYSALFIGLVPAFGLLTQIVGAPLIGFLADRFRARKLFLFISLLLLSATTLLFLVPRTVQKPCATSATRNSSSGENGTMADIIRSQAFAESQNLSSSKMHLFLHRTTTTIVTSKLMLTANRVHHNELLNEAAMDYNDVAKERVRFFLIILFLRGIYQLLQRLTITFITVATMTHIKDDKTKFGFYACWGEVGASLSLFLVGIMVIQTRHFHCSDLLPSYSIAFLYAAGVRCLILTSLPWLKYEYLERRVVNYREVKRIIFDPYYLLLLAVCVHGGICTSFQERWEFWYIEKLGGSPLVMAVGGLVRRFMVALWFFLSRNIIKQFGELHVITISLFIFAASFAALAFIANPWLVIVFDSFQSAAQVLMFSSLVIQFSKASSRASSAVILGLVNVMFYGIGKDIGTAITGWLFTSKGTTITLCCYSIVTALYLAIWMVYIFTTKDLDSYVEISSEDESDNEKK